MELLEYIKNHNEINTLLMKECDICFYKAATREPAFTCKYMDGEDEYFCDSIFSDNVGFWITELTGIKKEEIENYNEHI